MPLRPRNLRVTRLRARCASKTSLRWIEDEHSNDIASWPHLRSLPRRQKVFVIRAFLRSQEGWVNSRHNSSDSVNTASPRNSIALSMWQCIDTDRRRDWGDAPRRRRASIGARKKLDTFLPRGSRLVSRVLTQAGGNPHDSN